MAAAALLGGTLFSAADRMRPVTGSAGSVTKTLAVLPLTNGGADTADGYYVDGITDALTKQLGTLEGVRVPASPSAMRYRGSSKVPAGGIDGCDSRIGAPFANASAAK